jgi:hypothetical protein
MSAYHAPVESQGLVLVHFARAHIKRHRSAPRSRRCRAAAGKAPPRSARSPRPAPLCAPPSSAASFTGLRRSAPTRPGVAAGLPSASRPEGNLSRFRCRRRWRSPCTARDLSSFAALRPPCPAARSFSSAEDDLVAAPSQMLRRLLSIYGMMLVHRRRDAIKHATVRLDDGARRLGPGERGRVAIPRTEVGAQVPAQRAGGGEVGDAQRWPTPSFGRTSTISSRPDGRRRRHPTGSSSIMRRSRGPAPPTSAWNSCGARPCPSTRAGWLPRLAARLADQVGRVRPGEFVWPRSSPTVALVGCPGDCHQRPHLHTAGSRSSPVARLRRRSRTADSRKLRIALCESSADHASPHAREGPAGDTLTVLWCRGRPAFAPERGNPCSNAPVMVELDRRPRTRPEARSRRVASMSADRSRGPWAGRALMSRRRRETLVQRPDEWRSLPPRWGEAEVPGFV